MALITPDGLKAEDYTRHSRVDGFATGSHESAIEYDYHYNHNKSLIESSNGIAWPTSPFVKLKESMTLIARPSPHRKNAFSLVEMLVCIALIGILCSLAIPLMMPGNLYRKVRDQRHAQELASLCAAAQVAGLDMVVPGDLDATIDNLIRGGEVPTGIFKGRTFALRGMAPEDARAAAQFLEVVGNQLRFNKDLVKVVVVVGRDTDDIPIPA